MIVRLLRTNNATEQALHLAHVLLHPAQLLGDIRLPVVIICVEDVVVVELLGRAPESLVMRAKGDATDAFTVCGRGIGSRCHRERRGLGTCAPVQLGVRMRRVEE